MEALSTSPGAFSTKSSSSSVADYALKTPLDVTNPSPPDSFADTKMAIDLLSSRLEMVPKRAATLPSSPWVNAPLHRVAPDAAPPSHVRAGGRLRQTSISSTWSIASNNSLLRATLRLATNLSASRPATTGAPATNVATPIGTRSTNTPSPHTSRASSSSIASTTLSNPYLPHSDEPAGGPALSRKGPPSSSRPILDLSLAAEPTTALSPTTSPSLAQFSPIESATTSLLRYGIPTSRARYNSLGSGVKAEVRRKRSRDGRTASQDDHTNSRPHYDGHLLKNDNHDDTNAFKQRANAKNLPSISRTLEPNAKLSPSSIWAMGVAGPGDENSHAKLDAGIDVPVPMPYHYGSGLTASSKPSGSTREFNQGRGLPGTPRPPFPIQESPNRSLSTPPQQNLFINKEDAEPVSGFTALEKGKGRASTLPLPRAASDMNNKRVLTKTHFSHLLPAAAKPEPKPRDLPTLAAIESASRLMRSKIVCSTCGETGPDFPRCGRCGEAWCSRECRVKASSASATGKHRC